MLFSGFTKYFRKYPLVVILTTRRPIRSSRDNKGLPEIIVVGTQHIWPTHTFEDLHII